MPPQSIHHIQGSAEMGVQLWVYDTECILVSLLYVVVTVLFIILINLLCPPLYNLTDLFKSQSGLITFSLKMIHYCLEKDQHHQGGSIDEVTGPFFALWMKPAAHSLSSFCYNLTDPYVPGTSLAPFPLTLCSPPHFLPLARGWLTLHLSYWAPQLNQTLFSSLVPRALLSWQFLLWNCLPV